MLLPGNWVEVRSAAEIAATLDRDDCLDGLPFMPEMAAHCGRRFRVQVRAEWTCTFPFEANHRRLEDAVVLQTLRCDGAFHGGCQLGCMMFWKEAWLRRVDGPSSEKAPPVTDERPREFASRRREDATLYRCQGTEIPRATTPGPPRWHPAQYLRMLRVRTFNAREFIAMFAGVARRKLDRLVRRLGPSPAANAPRPPEVPLGLRPGELVTVKSKDAIRATLDAKGMVRGLSFAETMYVYCGRRMKVAARVERIIDERTGKLRHFAPGTVLLEGAICDRYRGCARNMPIMWREAWLERVVESEAAVRAPESGGGSPLDAVAAIPGRPPDGVPVIATRRRQSLPGTTQGEE
jgi:hypothetical protein